MLVLFVAAGCSDIGQPFNTPNPEPVCLAAAGLHARVADLQALDPSTSSSDEYLTDIYEVKGAAETLVDQARVLAEQEAGQVQQSFIDLEDAAQELPSDTDPAEARTALSDEINAARIAVNTLNTRLSCPPLPTAAPA
jgi:hypothetical protein